MESSAPLANRGNISLKLYFIDMWYKKFEELSLFVATKHRYPSSVIPEEASLYDWANVQKNKYKSNRIRLTLDMISKLESLPNWTWHTRVYGSKIEITVNLLNDYIRQYKGCSIMPPNIVRAHTLLRDRLMLQVPPKNIGLVQTVIGWEHLWVDFKWNIMLYGLRNFIAEHQRQPRKIEGETMLYGWCMMQRRAFAAGKLNASKIDKLQTTQGWTWELAILKQKSRHDLWISVYSELLVFINANHRFPTKKQGENKLYNWVALQRYRLRDLVLKKRCGETVEGREDDYTRIEMLDRIDGWEWNVEKYTKWNRSYDRLKRFIAEHGRYPQSEKADEQVLCKWVRSQQVKYQKYMVQQGVKSMNKHKFDVRRNMLMELPDWNWGQKI